MIFRFDDCELDDARSELRRAGKPVELQPKPLALLALLIAERHRVVPKDELLDTLWPDAVVTESSLTRAVSLARRAIGDRGQRARIRSHARRGYRFVGHAIELDESAGPVVSSKRPSTDASTAHAGTGDPFIGRGEALAALHDGWVRAASGWGSVITLQGPAGIGKSRLAETFASSLAVDGQWVFVARSDEGTAAPAFWMWVQVLRELARCTDLQGHVRELGTPPGEIARLVPELAPLATDPEPPADPERFLLFGSVTRLLERCCADRPIAIVLEDLHLAGPESLALLEHLAARLRDQRLLILGLVRDEVRDRRHPLSRTLANLARHGHSRQVVLTGFGPAEVEALVRQWTGQPPPRSWVDELLARTEGNPLFLREAVRSMLDRGGLDSPAALGRIDLEGLPQRVFDLVERNLERLSSQTAAVLDAAAVIGRQFAVSFLERVAGTPREDLLDALDEAALAGVVAESEERPGVFAFAHPLFREAIVDGLRSGRRARLHLAAAAALEEIHAADPSAVLSELAYHHHGALGVGDATRAQELAQAAARKAQASFAWEPAARHLEQALAALDQQPGASATRRVDTLLELGRAHHVAGDRHKRREVYATAMELARQLGDVEGLSRAALGFCDLGEWSAQDPEGQGRVGEALAALEPSDANAATRARLLARQVYNIRVKRPDAEPGAREAVALARATGDPEALVEALYTLHFVLAGPDDLAERAALVAEMRRLAPAAGDRDLCLIGQVDIAGDRIIEGDRQGARRERAEVDVVTGPNPHRAALWHKGIHDTGVALMEGRFDDARRGIEDCYAIGSWIQHPAAVMCRVGHSLLLQRELGEKPEMLRRTVDADTGTAHIGFYAAAMVAAVRAAAGRARAQAAFEELVDERLPVEPRAIDWLLAMTELAGLAVRFEDAERAGALIEQLEPYAGLHAAVPVLVSYSGPVVRSLGLLAAVKGDLARAVEYLEDARSAAEAMGALPTLARIDADLGGLLVRRGKERAGRELLARAAAQASALGMAAPVNWLPQG